MSALTDEQLKAKKAEFKEWLSKGETLDDILPEAFAVCREADWREAFPDTNHWRYRFAQMGFINCVWVAVAGLLVPDFIYNIGTTVLNGGISMVIFFFVNKIIFPESGK